MAAYPTEPFKQADSLLTGLIESYRGSTDAQDIADIQSLVETTVKIARDREYRVQNDVKDLSQKVSQVEAAAVYSDAKAAHEQNVAQINTIIADVQQDVHRVHRDVCGTQEQQAELQQQQQQLLADREELMRLQHVVEPDKLKRISLYAHITDVMFDYGSLGGPVIKATVSDSGSGDIRDVTLDKQENHFEAVNKLWEQIPCPVMQS